VLDELHRRFGRILFDDEVTAASRSRKAGPCLASGCKRASIVLFGSPAVYVRGLFLPTTIALFMWGEVDSTDTAGTSARRRPSRIVDSRVIASAWTATRFR